MNLIHSLPSERQSPERFFAAIEISAGTSSKYEIDHETGALILDRFLSTSTHYPHNYGFIPKTWADDGDPLDVLVISSGPIIPMALVECHAIGLLEMKDGGRRRSGEGSFLRFLHFHRRAPKPRRGGAPPLLPGI